MVSAMEIGGRWSEEAYTFLTLLAQTKAKQGPKTLRSSTQYCLVRRWTQMVSVAAQSALAASLLGESATKTPFSHDVLPDWGEVLCDREVPAEGNSKLL